MGSQAHRSHEQLDDLLRRLVGCLPELPGFRTLSLFGSLAEGRADPYSDIDLIVTTDDLPAAQAQLLGVLRQIGPIEFCWAIPLRPDEWNPTVVFAEQGYYHRLELGLAATEAVGRTIPPEQTTLLVEGCITQAGHKRAIDVGRVYVPKPGSAGHFLLGQFLAGIRYVKGRKRGQTATCYRSAVSTADASMCALHAYAVGEHPRQGRLTASEYSVLDSLDAGACTAALLESINFSTPGTMDRAVCALLTRMANLCRKIASAQQETLPLAVFRRMLGFFHHELGVQPAPPAYALPDDPG